MASTNLTILDNSRQGYEVFSRIGSMRPIAYTLSGLCTSEALTFADVPHATWGFDFLTMVPGKPELSFDTSGNFVRLTFTSGRRGLSCYKKDDPIQALKTPVPGPNCYYPSAANQWPCYEHVKAVTDRFIDMSATKALISGCAPKEVAELHGPAAPFDDSTFETALLSARNDIAALVEGMLSNKPLDRSNSFLELCEQAARQSDESQETDIEDWSKRLAEDLGKLTD